MVRCVPRCERQADTLYRIPLAVDERSLTFSGPGHSMLDATHKTRCLPALARHSRSS